MTALTQYPGLAFGLALVWAALACLLPLVRMRRRPPCLFALVVCGVPVLGWLTLICGPGFGVLFLALGLSLLVWPPLESLRRRRRPHSTP
ncbi:DUF2484 domain-containing protein [Paracoccus yeei]|jgi:hypothetical protein|uniref:DUF2484 domain-containing protein n=1 Tax=Paracoccus yeei TaxID=147645 RepID=A0A1V0GPH4_9RHOB|nr:DUF2484 family protein [Paracoccus yeei]ARC35757.1 DUF2484 domain-containing protein [Paracoccus yeei]QEU09599.1 DUF2484 family protein [Paracoccus yeei]